MSRALAGIYRTIECGSDRFVVKKDVDLLVVMPERGSVYPRSYAESVDFGKAIANSFELLERT